MASVVVIIEDDNVTGNDLEIRMGRRLTKHAHNAGHSPDVDNYPYEYFLIRNPDAVYRFLHIERVDGLRMYFPLIEGQS